MKPKRCLVLGGGGFIGSGLSAALLEAGNHVRVFDLHHPGINNSHFEFFEGNFLNEADLLNAVHDVDVVFHLISTTHPSTSNKDPQFDVQSNIISTLKLLDYSVKANVERFVFASSGGTVYGVPEVSPIAEKHPTNPTCSYGITKLSIEKYLQIYQAQYGMDCRVLRIANPYGPGQKIIKGQGVITAFVEKAVKGDEIEVWGDGSVVRDFIYLDDLYEAFINLLDYSGPETIFNIGSGQGVSLKEILNGIKAILPGELNVTYKHSRGFDVPENVLDISLAKRELNWSPQVSFMDGLKRYIDQAL